MNRLHMLACALLGASSVGLLGCQPDLDFVRVSAITTPPVAPTVREGSIRLAAGTGLGVSLAAYTDDRDDPPLDPDSLRVRSRDENVATILYADADVYIVVGARPGTTVLEVSSTEAVGTWEIAAEVVEQ